MAKNRIFVLGVTNTGQALIFKPLCLGRFHPRTNSSIHEGFFECLHNGTFVGERPHKFFKKINHRCISNKDRQKKDVTLDAVAKRGDFNCIILYVVTHKKFPFEDDELYSLTNTNMPVVQISVDYRCDRGKVFDNVGLHLLRHSSEVKYSPCVYKHALPFSIDPKIWSFKPLCDREMSLCFSGSSDWKYPFRRRILSSNNIVVSDRKMSPDVQAQFYQKYLAALSSTSKFDYLIAKHFEIASTGTILFTNGGEIEKYLPSDLLMKCNNDSDVDTLLSDIKHHMNFWQIKTKKLSEYVQAYHNHEERWGEMIALINDVFDESFVMGDNDE